MSKQIEAMKQAIIEEASIQMTHPSKDARFFAKSVYTYLTAEQPASVPVPGAHKPLTDELEALFANIDHAISSGAWNVQRGSQTWEIIEEAKAAHGITKREAK